jgi:hypothetical protein
MIRYSHVRRPALAAGLVATAAVAISAVPSGATIVCPKGVKPPSPYCTNVRPTAILKTYNYGSLRAGTYTKKINAPNKKGSYVVEVFARLSCGKQMVKHKLTVK